MSDEPGSFEYGSVEGTVQGIWTHGSPSFWIFQSTGHGIECKLGDRVPLEDVLAAYGKNVVVTGVLRRSSKLLDMPDYELISVQVDELHVLPSEALSPVTNDI